MKRVNKMIRKLMRSIREYKLTTILTPVLVALEVAMEVIIPLLMSMLIDYGIEKNDMGYIVNMGLLLVACAALSLFFGAMAGVTAAKASAGFAKNLRHDMFYSLQDFSFRNIDNFACAKPRNKKHTGINTEHHKRHTGDERILGTGEV